MLTKIDTKTTSPKKMVAGNKPAAFLAESFLDDFYLFRRNVLSGKTEYQRIVKDSKESTKEEESNAQETEVETSKSAKDETAQEAWKILTPEAINSIVRRAKKMGIGGKQSPRQDIIEYLKSEDIPLFDPIRTYLKSLPKWDGKNHVAALFGRIPGLTSEQLAWCATWLRSSVAHWLQMDMLHGNEAVPVLIGQQGCGKSTFAVRLLPEQLRMYFLDHINFGNKFDTEMALTHNLYVNIDEFANMGPSQQGKLKQTLSKVKMNGRPIFGNSQDDRPRYASFLATTNDEHPLCDPTGSRRYICLHIPTGAYIDNDSVISYDQLYAQVMHELRHNLSPYWFTNAEVARIQEQNLPFFKTEDLESMLAYCFKMPTEKEEGKWMVCSEVFKVLHEQYPMLVNSLSTKVKIGQTLKFMGCQSKHTKYGQAYHLIHAESYAKSRSEVA